MKKGIIIASLLLNSAICMAQSEQNIWAFGEGAGLNFNVAGPASYSDNLIPGMEGCASICNATGSMLFYSNGYWVWDKYNHLMPALTGGVPGYTWPIATSVGYPPLLSSGSGVAIATQPTAICNVPAHPGKYYLFSLSTTGQLYYSIIDTTLNGGAGDLITSKMRVYIGGDFAEKMTVVKGCNNIWLVVRSQIANQYKCYEINDTGIITTPIISNVGSLPLSWYQCGVIKFSPDGSKMAAACNYGSTNTGGLELYDFDKRTGIISNARILDSSSSDGYYYGACFSPDNTKLYTTTSSYNISGTIHPGTVKQFDVGLGTTAAIIASNTLLYTDTALPNNDIGDLKRGIDGKIYIPSKNNISTSAHMHVINYPDIAGVSCGFIPNSLLLSVSCWLYKGLPNDVVILPVPDTIKTVQNIAGCFKDSTVITAHDTGGKDYVWTGGLVGKAIAIHSNGVYTTSYVNSDCKYEVDVFNVNFVHVPTISPVSYSCDGQKQGTAWVKPANSDTATFEFTWIDVNGTVLQQHITYTADTISGLDTGVYTMQVHTAGGCDTILRTHISGMPTPQASASIDSIVCKGNAVTFSAHTNGDAWKWYFGDDSVSDNLNTSHYYKQAGDYTVYFTASNIEGCSDTVTRTVQVRTFSIGLSSDKDNINIGEQITLQTTGSEPYTVTEWEPANLFTEQTALTQSLKLDTTHTFVVFGQSSFGCSDTAMITVFVNPVVFLPLAFTPNGDGLNDRFRPRTAGSGVFVDDFEIYNRWGQMVWYGYGANAAEGWDGKFHGIDAEVGTYFYTIHVVTPSGGTISRKGDVTLIR